MATKIPRVIADLELQLATALAVGGESFTLSSATDDDGESLPAGIYVFAVDSGTSNKEYLLGQVNGTAVTAVKSVSRQGVQTTGAARAHRVGSPIILTNFAALQLVSDTLRGAVDLDGATPLAYDAEPTLGNREELATVGYVLDTATGGTVTFDAQTIAGTAGATIAAGDLVYFNEADQEWYLCDADTAATVEGVMRGIALGSGTDGVAITGGVHLAGAWTTTGLTAGAVYYASNTAGALATSAGTTKHIVGVALSTTRLWVIPQHRETIPTRTKDALVGGGAFGTPSTSNKFLTEEYTNNGVRTTYEVADSPATWTKRSGLKKIFVQMWGGGGSGCAATSSGVGTESKGGGGGGAYAEAWFSVDEIGATETITVGAGGAAVSRSQSVSGDGVTSGNNGTNSSFGSLLTAPGGTAPGGTSNRSGGQGGAISWDYGRLAEATSTLQIDSTFGGAGGARGESAGGTSSPGNSIYGGAGGGAINYGGGETGGGTSKYGGNGGAGASSTATDTTGVSGSVPGGGGGSAARLSSASGTATSGAGGNGRVIVTEFYS